MLKVDVVMPTGVQQLLKVLQDALTPQYNVTLVGGFLRDTYGRAPIKDIDIMISPAKDYLAYEEVINLVMKAGLTQWFTPKGEFCSEYMEELKSRGVDRVIMGECPKLGNIETQLIVYDHPISREQIASDMDINICQIVGTPQGNVFASPAFMSGFATKTLEVLQGKDNPEREQKRLVRISNKYPEFTVKELV